METSQPPAVRVRSPIYTAAVSGSRAGIGRLGVAGLDVPRPGVDRPGIDKPAHQSMRPAFSDRCLGLTGGFWAYAHRKPAMVIDPLGRTPGAVTGPFQEGGPC